MCFGGGGGGPTQAEETAAAEDRIAAEEAERPAVDHLDRLPGGRSDGQDG